MNDYEIDMYGNAGIYLADGNTFTFQLGEGDPALGAEDYYAVDSGIDDKLLYRVDYYRL